MKYLLGAFALLFLIMFSGVVTVYVFSGLLMFGGIVALCESMPPVKYFVAKTGHLVDLLMFGFGVYAISSMGVTVAIGLSVAGLLFSVYYKPYLRATLPKSKKRAKATKAKKAGMSEARHEWINS